MWEVLRDGLDASVCITKMTPIAVIIILFVMNPGRKSTPVLPNVQLWVVLRDGPAGFACDVVTPIQI